MVTVNFLLHFLQIHRGVRLTSLLRRSTLTGPRQNGQQIPDGQRTSLRKLKHMCSASAVSINWLKRCCIDLLYPPSVHSQSLVFLRLAEQMSRIDDAGASIPKVCSYAVKSML